MMSFLDPHSWKNRYVAIFLGIMALISLFGPRGIVHFIVLKQEQMRVDQANLKTQAQIALLKKEISGFQRSSMQRYRVLREEMGYLEQHEYSVEFSDSRGPILRKPASVERNI